MVCGHIQKHILAAVNIEASSFRTDSVPSTLTFDGVISHGALVPTTSNWPAERAVLCVFSSTVKCELRR